MNTNIYIYVLKLKNKKYYVGRTKDLDKRIEEHKNGEGSEWTNKYKFVKILEKFEGDVYDEDKYTIKYMDKYGIDNVRGGTFSNIDLSYDDFIYINKMLANAKDKCLRCYRDNHFISNCFANSDIYGNELP